ncbi:sigma-70 family RNA polymerase sigma factor [uncultured Bacteroides sp.]|uniref:sigma-70 family RNA polymerase sigma factor n=1 Tax=uncultured Bacteroides sp. TaxID=162156 RepID=UPI0027D9B142|nr:sigma-70 family RNA polymerase sigma factor [uncultured Bacteroides sp.]
MKIFTKDIEIAKALINRDNLITKKYLYIQCYPLFKSIFDKYYTDCDTCKDFIDEMYLVVLSPSKKTGKCQMENFRGESTLAKWLKTACLFYCYEKFEKRIPIVNIVSSNDEDVDSDANDRFIDKINSTNIDFSSINRADVEKILSLMPNVRYRNIIRLHYLEEKSNEETAEALGMSMDNYYNKHKLAKEQYIRIWRKEAQNG